MEYIKLFITICICFMLILKIINNPNTMIFICIIYYFADNIYWIISGNRVIELFNIFGISFQLIDMICILMIVPLIYYLKGRVIKINSISILLFLLIFILAYQFVLGIFQYGNSPSVIGDYRTFIPFLVSILYFYKYFDICSVSKYIKYINFIMNFILIFSFSLWSIDIVGGTILFKSQMEGMLSDGGSTMRFMQAYGVLIIAIYSIYLIRNDIKNKGIIGIKALFFSGAVVLFQHRTIWISFFIALIFIFIDLILSKRIDRKLLIEIIYILFFFIVVILFLNDFIIDKVFSLVNLFISVILGRGYERTTLFTRLEVWNTVINNMFGFNILIGYPFGSGYASEIGWTNSPHSGYIRILSKAGYIGLIILIVLIIRILYISYKKKIPYITEIMICIMIFMIGYDFTLPIGCLIGVFLNIIYNTKKENYNNKYGYKE